MTLSHEELAYIAMVISMVGYIPYIYSTLRNRTKPHVFSWLIWAIMMGVMCMAQLEKGAGPGAWVMMLSSSMCCFITILAVFKGTRFITRMDWAALALAGAGIGAWQVTGDPLLAVLLMIAVDILATLPTVRKSWYRPHEELAWLYGVNVVRFSLSILALQSINVVTILPLITVIIVEGALCLMIIYRRLVIEKRRARLARRRKRQASTRKRQMRSYFVVFS